MLTDCGCGAVLMCGWDASGNSIGSATLSRVESSLRVCREAALVAARCRLALAMGFASRLCEHSVLADCPVDCISMCGAYCSTQLMIRVSFSNDGKVPAFPFEAKTATSSPVESALAFSFAAKPAASCMAGSSPLAAFSLANNPAASSLATAAMPAFRFTPPKHAGRSASSCSTGGAVFSFGSSPSPLPRPPTATAAVVTTATKAVASAAKSRN